jgi:hypothetical protein
MRLPVHALDDVAMSRDHNRTPRTDLERQMAVDDILASSGWIAEGIHLGWTDPLLEAADLVIWLDHVSWPAAGGAILKRFITGSLAEARRQKGVRRFLRWRDYVARLRELVAALPQARAYHTQSTPGGASTDASRAATADRLSRLGPKVVHCRSSADIQAVRDRLIPRPC